MRFAALILLALGTPASATSPVDPAGPVMHANRAAFRVCYTRELARKPGLEGKVVVRFTIGADGRVAQSHVRQTSLRDEAVESCLLRHLATLKFPGGDDSTEVEFAFAFVARGR